MTPIEAALPVETRFLGGAVCLDFANTTEQLRSPKPIDWLSSYEVLLTWSRVRGTLDGDVVERLARKALRERQAAREIFARARDIRSDIRVVAAALASGQSTAKVLPRLNSSRADLPPQPAIVAWGNQMRFELRGARLDEPLWPILWSLTALLTSSDCRRISRCEGHGCGYFFVDTTLNRSRRFCSTAGCGNRARARRHHARRRTSA